MRAERSKKTLWWGLGLTILGLAGMFLFHGADPGMVPFSGWGGGGVTSSPEGNQWPGAMEMMLVGTMLFMLRRRWLAMRSPMSKAQSPKR